MKAYLVSIILCISASLYLYYDREVFSQITFTGRLSEDAYRGTYGGESNFDCLILKVDGEKYIIRNCSYRVADVGQIMMLKKNDRVDLSLSESKIIDGQSVVSLTSEKYGSLIDQKEFSACADGRWKIPFYLGLLVIAVFLTDKLLHLFRL